MSTVILITGAARRLSFHLINFSYLESSTGPDRGYAVMVTCIVGLRDSDSDEVLVDESSFSAAGHRDLQVHWRFTLFTTVSLVLVRVANYMMI